MKFKEVFTAKQLNAETYSYSWNKYDMYYGEIVDSDYEQECSKEQLIEAANKHEVNLDDLFEHFALQRVKANGTNITVTAEDLKKH